MNDTEIHAIMREKEEANERIRRALEEEGEFDS